jgi:hypothetical protein
MKLSILLYAFENAQTLPIIEQIKNKLQGQLNSIPSDDIEVVFCTDPGEKSIEEMRQWLIEQSEAKHYVFITTDTEINDNFVLLRYNAIIYRKSIEELVKLNIYHK